MSKLFSALILAIAGIFVFATVATANPPSPKWYLHANYKHYVCDANYHNAIAGPFKTKDECEDLLDPRYGPVCSDGETLNVWFPKVYVILHEDTSFGSCEVPPASRPKIVIPRVDHDFLCADKWAVNPYVLTHAEALVAFNDWGWWVPFAVLGNVEGGTNIGGYHLVCNLPSTLKAAPTAPVVDNNGVMYDAQYEAEYRDYYTPALGIYKVAS